ncbi:MAG: hypothetical protein ACR2L9_09010, partial [Solirubrobacteraceae bacterium]
TRAPAVHVTVAAHGTTVVLKLSCPPGTSACAAVIVRVTVTLHLKGSKVIAVTAHKLKSHTKRLVIATGHASLAAGATKTLALTLNSAGRALHRKHHRLRVTVRITSTGAKPSAKTVALH